MKCPRCVQVIHRGAELCPHCGFGIGEMDARYGKDNPSLRRLADPAGLIRLRERAKVQAALDHFSLCFPQLFAAVYTCSSRESGNLRQFGFWLLNRAAFEDVPVEQPNEAGILLVIDPEAKSAGVSWGYLLDPYLTEDDTFVCLSRAHAYFLEGNFADGIVRFVGQLENILSGKLAQARRDPDRFGRKVAPPLRGGGIGRRIRDGHRQSPSKTGRVER